MARNGAPEPVAPEASIPHKGSATSYLELIQRTVASGFARIEQRAKARPPKQEGIDQRSKKARQQKPEGRCQAQRSEVKVPKNVRTAAEVKKEEELAYEVAKRKRAHERGVAHERAQMERSRAVQVRMRAERAERVRQRSENDVYDQEYRMDINAAEQYTKKVSAKRGDIINTISGTARSVSKRSRPWAILLAGGPGVGKSTILRYLQDCGTVPSAVVIDCDAIRMRLPEWKRAKQDAVEMTPADARLRLSRARAETQFEAGKVAELIASECFKQHKCFVFDSTLRNLRFAREFLARSKSQGYVTCIIRVLADLGICQTRVVEREEKTGRPVEPDFVATCNEASRKVVDAISGEANLCIHIVNNHIGMPVIDDSAKASLKEFTISSHSGARGSAASSSQDGIGPKSSTHRHQSHSLSLEGVAGGSSTSRVQPAQRDTVRQKLLEALDAPGSQTEDAQGGISKQRLLELATEIEEALHEQLSDSAEYLSQARSIIFNVRDRSNDAFVLAILSGVYQPKGLPHMTAEKMAGSARSAERAKVRKQASCSYMLKPEEQYVTDRFTCEKCSGAKTAYSQSMATESCVRSGGEPVMTVVTFATCLICSHCWTERSGFA